MVAAFDAGVNFFDCAEGYSDGRSEAVMGQIIKKHGWKRNDLVISTKIYFGTAHGRVRANNGGLSRKHLVEGTNAALERLQLDYVDLLYAHRPDRATPLEETVRAFNHLIDRGKCFYWGTSEWSAEEISAAWGVADRLGLVGPLMEQPQYNLLARERVEREYALLYERHGLGLTVFSPLRGGVLTGKYNDQAIPATSRLATSDNWVAKREAKRVGTDDFGREIEKVKALQPIADRLKCDTAALALAWVVRNPKVSSAITGASRPEQVVKSVKALEVVPKLTDEIMAEIDGILDNKPDTVRRRLF